MGCLRRAILLLRHDAIIDEIIVFRLCTRNKQVKWCLQGSRGEWKTKDFPNRLSIRYCLINIPSIMWYQKVLTFSFTLWSADACDIVKRCARQTAPFVWLDMHGFFTSSDFEHRGRVGCVVLCFTRIFIALTSRLKKKLFYSCQFYRFFGVLTFWFLSLN